MKMYKNTYIVLVYDENFRKEMFLLNLNYFRIYIIYNQSLKKELAYMVILITCNNYDSFM